MSKTLASLADEGNVNVRTTHDGTRCTGEICVEGRSGGGGGGGSGAALAAGYLKADKRKK